MNGLIAAAGRCTRMQDLGEKRSKVLADLGGVTVLGSILTNFETAGVGPTHVMVGYDAEAVRHACAKRAVCHLNPFHDHAGILGSVWLARQWLDGTDFVFTVGDHYFVPERLDAFFKDQPHADLLVDVELKTCDDEDMKVYVTKEGGLRTMSKVVQNGTILGEFTGLLRFSAEGSRVFFDTLEKYVWQHGIQGYVADVLCAYHRKYALAFHLSDDHRRLDIDFPRDLDAARKLYRLHGKSKAA